MQSSSVFVRTLACLSIAAGLGACHGPGPEGAPAEYEAPAIATGAVAPPDGVAVVLPFPAGRRARVHAGYGPNGGSNLHVGTNQTCCANDYYALDLLYDDAPDSGIGEPVLAPFPGVVVKAGWASAGWANYGQRVILTHDLGDGHVYDTIYCHLSRISDGIIEGATVAAGQQIGALGRSCMGALSCSSFSTPHLHFAMHRDANIGGSGTGGSYGGHAVVPEPLEGVTGVSRGLIMISSNSGGGPPPPPPPPPGFCDGKLDGLWCDGNDLVRCQSSAEASRMTCSYGCESRPVGVDDRCYPPPPPPPGFCQGRLNGLWCDGNDLVRCLNDNEVDRMTCANGCESRPVGIDDRCYP